MNVSFSRSSNTKPIIGHFEALRRIFSVLKVVSRGLSSLCPPIFTPGKKRVKFVFIFPHENLNEEILSDPIFRSLIEGFFDVDCDVYFTRNDDGGIGYRCRLISNRENFPNHMLCATNHMDAFRRDRKWLRRSYDCKVTSRGLESSLVLPGLKWRRAWNHQRLLALLRSLCRESPLWSMTLSVFADPLKRGNFRLYVEGPMGPSAFQLERELLPGLLGGLSLALR